MFLDVKFIDVVNSIEAADVVDESCMRASHNYGSAGDEVSSRESVWSVY